MKTMKNYSHTTHSLSLKVLIDLFIVPSGFVIFQVNIRIKLLSAIRADTMSQLSFGMLMDVVFELLPVAVVIANFFAMSLDGQEPFQ